MTAHVSPTPMRQHAALGSPQRRSRARLRAAACQRVTQASTLGAARWGPLLAKPCFTAGSGYFRAFFERHLLKQMASAWVLLLGHPPELRLPAGSNHTGERLSEIVDSLGGEASTNKHGATQASSSRRAAVVRQIESIDKS
ncbi:unnamed protein product [Prorocentrum cordatum]|uniref:Uncharacterized protein n=1 Tax=Prorocentrum cordatum TaxID=2364126 RepID=A0ABN9UN87_9DINO|nr:unnamed protein product [Polarella glacialis]